MFSSLHKKCKERESKLMERIGEEVEHQEAIDKAVLNKRVEQLHVYINELKAEKEKSWMVDPEYVFSVGKIGQIFLNGTQITNVELKNLKSEVRTLKEFQIYKIIQSTLRQKAIEKAVLTSTDLYSLKGNEQVLAGKMMVFCLDIIKTIVQDIDATKMK